jgi:hypothetical protein
MAGISHQCAFYYSHSRPPDQYGSCLSKLKFGLARLNIAELVGEAGHAGDYSYSASVDGGLQYRIADVAGDQ